MNTDKMFRVLATHWEAESFTECWCRTKEEADRIARLLRSDTTVGDTEVQVDKPKS